MITQNFDLNMIPESEPVIVRVNQYDTGMGRLVAHLYNGDLAYTPASGATVVIQGTKPDLHGFQYEATLSGNTVTADLKQQMTACFGDVRTQIVVTESNGKTGTFVFILKVQQSALQDDTDISDTEIPAIVDAAEANAERAEAAADRAEAAVVHGPYIDDNTAHWWVWDGTQNRYVDTGISADGSTTTYNSLTNKPQINGNELVGNKTGANLGLQNTLVIDENGYINL